MSQIGATRTYKWKTPIRNWPFARTIPVNPDVFGVRNMYYIAYCMNYFSYTGE
jgi:hypothetical protein